MARLRRRSDIYREQEDPNFREAMPTAAPAPAYRRAEYVRESVVVRDRFSPIVGWITGIVEFFLGLDLLFRLLGASSANGFVAVIENVGDWLARPFFGTATATLSSTTRFSVTMLIAMLVYALVGWLLIALVHAVRGKPEVM